MENLNLIQGQRYLFQRRDGGAVTYVRATYVSGYGGPGWSTTVCRDVDSNPKSKLRSDVCVRCVAGREYVHMNANLISNAYTLLDVVSEENSLNDDVLRYIDEFW